MKYLKLLYFQVLIAIVIGALLGVWIPGFAVELKPLGDLFVSLIKMIIAPVIFCTVVLGIAQSGDVKKVGRVGGKAFLYFESVSNIALVIGLIVVNLIKPGEGFNVDPASLDASLIEGYQSKAADTSVIEVIKRIIPKTFLDAFSANGDLLQVLLVALLFGFALNRMGSVGKNVRDLIETTSHIFLVIVHWIMRVAPIGALGAMAFTIGKFGIESFGPLVKFMATFYLTCIIFVFVVLGVVARLAGFRIWSLLKYLKEEIFTVLGTSSSESVLAPLMQKMEKLGCSRSVVGIVVPAGYSFNLDGTNIYMTMAAIFIAQALNIELTLWQQLTLLFVSMIISNGASGVTGSGFITLAATLAAVPSVPVAGLALILGIDRFMSEARALTNFIGNSVATLVISKWEKDLNMDQLHLELEGRPKYEEK